MAGHKTKSPSNHVIEITLAAIIQVIFIQMVSANESELSFSSPEIDQIFLNSSILTDTNQSQENDEIFNLSTTSNTTRNNFQNKALTSPSKQRAKIENNKKLHKNDTHRNIMCDCSLKASKNKTKELEIEESIEINASQNTNNQTEAALNNLETLQEQVKDHENNLEEMEKFLTVLMDQKDDQYDEFLDGKELKNYQTQSELRNKNQQINIAIKIPKNKNSAWKIVMKNLKELQNRLKLQQTILDEMRKQTKLLMKQKEGVENKVKQNECEKKLQTASETIRSLVNNLKNVENQSTQTEDKTDELYTPKKNNHDLKKKLNQCRNESNEKTYQLQTASKYIQDLQSQSEGESENKKKEVQIAKKNIQDVQNQLNKCQNESQKKTEQLKATSKNIQNLQNQSNHCHNDSQKNFEELQAASKNIQDLQSQSKQLKEESENINKKLQLAKKNIQEVQNQLNECENESQKKAGQLQTASKNIQFLQYQLLNQCKNNTQKRVEQLQTAAMNIKDLQNQLKESQSKCKNETGELYTASKNLHDLQNQLKQLQDELQNKSKQIQDDSYTERLQAIIKRICVLEIFFGGSTALGYYYELKSVPISIIIKDASNVQSDDELAKTKYILKFINQLSNISDAILAYETVYADIKEKETIINNTCLNFLKILVLKDGIQNSMAKTILSEINTKFEDNFVDNMKDLWVNIILGKDNKCEVTKIENFFEVYSHYFGDNLHEILQRVFNEGYTLPDKYDTIIEFTKNIPSMLIKSQVYNILHNELHSNYLINNYHRITKFAYYIMNAMREQKYPILLYIKNHFPSWIQDLIWNGNKCKLKNHKYPGYLFSDGKSKIYSERERSDSQYSKYTPTNKVDWKFESSDYGETFTIRNIVTDEYLYAENNSTNNETGRKVLANKILTNIKGRSLWKILPTLDPKFIIIKNAFFDEDLFTENIHRSRDKFSNYSAYLWRPYKSPDQKIEWELIC